MIPLSAWAFLVLAATPAAAGDATPLSDVFDKVKDSVVIVRTVQADLAPQAVGAFVRVGGLGSGVLVDPRGLVLTAAHVVQAAEAVQVEFASGEAIPARVLTSETLADVALLELERPPTRPVVARLGDSDRMRVGDVVFVVGAPLGMSHSLSVGHMGGRRSARILYGGLAQAELLQTDAGINQGNSGGPMFDMKGEVVGIVSSILSRSGGFEGIGFAIASNTARRILVERPPWSGIEGLMIEGPLAAMLNVPQPVGLLVQRVSTSSPAGKMGIRPGVYRAEIEGESLLLGGDIILAVGGVRLSDENGPGRIREQLVAAVPGSPLIVTILRGGRIVELRFDAPER
jgi:serine protease Do